MRASGCATLLVAFGLIAAGCGRGGEDAPSEPRESPEPPELPANGAPVDEPEGFRPGHYDRLLALVPEQAGSWKRKDASGQMIDVAGGQHAHVRTVFEREGEYNLIHMQLIDGGGDPTVVGVFQTMVDTVEEGRAAGYEQLQLQGYPAVQTWLRKPVNSTLHVLIEGRYMLILSGEGLEPPHLLQVAGALDLTAVASGR